MPHGRRRFLMLGLGGKAALPVILVALSLPNLALAQFKMPDQKAARAQIHAPLTSGSAMLKGNSAGGFSNAVAGTDYQGPISDNSLNSHNFANRINAGGTLLGAQPACSDLTGAAAHCGTNASELISGTVPASQIPPNFTAQTVSSSSANPARRGLIDDVNNHTSVAASDAANDGNDIAEIGTDASNVVHLGGGGASAISLDNSAAVNQGTFSSGAYLDVPANNTSYTGGTEHCGQTVHNYTLGANATITLSCTGTQNQTLDYYLFQPRTSSTFTYTFVAGNGASLFGDTPAACAANGCIDHVQVTWIPSQNDYLVNLLKANITGIATCPAGQTCYYVSTSGNDSNSGTDTSHTWLTIDKANSILSTLNPGDEILFHGGDTWNGSNSLNHPFYLGDTAAHSAAGSSTKPILISTYGTGRAIFDMANNQPECFAEMNPSNGNPPPTSNVVKYVTINNFECEHAYTQGVVIQPNGSVSPGMTVTGTYIHNVGYGCSTSSTACIPATIQSTQDTYPPDWQSGHAYVANSSSTATLIVPGSTNTWFYETVPSCTSGGSSPAFPTTGTAGVTSLPDGSCTWVYAGAHGKTYSNALHFFDSTRGSNSVHFTNNIVRWNGGHNNLQVDGDQGSPLVQGNIVGPGGIHGGIDLKQDGDYMASPPNLAQVIDNTVTCGYSLGLCGCQGNSSCSSGQTPSIYLQNTFTTSHMNVLLQLNTVYDSFVGLQETVSGGANDCATTTNTCPIQAKFYNNTIYLAPTSTTTYCAYAGGGNGRKANSIIDVRNNICDGTTTLFSVPTGTTAWASTIEDYNDLGGSQGYTTSYSFNTSTTHGSHDLVCQSSCSGSSADPVYANAGASPPNFGLQAQSPLINAGLSGLTTGNTNIGAN